MPQTEVDYRDSPTDPWTAYLGGGHLLQALLERRFHRVVRAKPTDAVGALNALHAVLDDAQGIHTTAQFATALGVDRSTVYRVLNRRSRPSTRLVRAAIRLATTNGYPELAAVLQRHKNPQATNH